jgi:hypothetical protein
MAGRKTVDVITIVSELQKALDRAKIDEERRAFCYAIERILHMSDNYRGFQHFDEKGEWTAEDCMVGEGNYYRRRYYNGRRM